jgi:hypothetical protein
MFNRANVQLVDLAGEGLEAVTPTGVVAHGREYACDDIILATGACHSRKAKPP